MKKFILLILLIPILVYAQDNLNYPLEADTTIEKFEYSLQVKEKLIELHNQKGKDYRDGKITAEEWQKWKEEYFKPMLDKILDDLRLNRANLKKQLQESTTYTEAIRLDSAVKVDR